MFEFINKIKTFLALKFSEDKDFEVPISVNEEYLFNHKLEGTEVQVGLLDNSEYERGTTFNGELVTYAPIQLTVYSVQMKIGNTARNPRDVAVIVADKICRYMSDLVNKIDDVLICQRTDYSAPFPMNEGATRYFVAVRYDILIDCPY